MEFCPKKESISWIEGNTDKILFLEGKYENMVKQMEFCLNEGFISWIKGRTDKSLFIEESWHPTGATPGYHGSRQEQRRFCIYWGVGILWGPPQPKMAVAN